MTNWLTRLTCLIMAATSGQADRPEIKNDAEETVTSNVSALTEILRAPDAYWTTCVSWFSPNPEETTSSRVWMLDDDGNAEMDRTRFAFSKDEPPVSENCVTKEMKVVFETDGNADFHKQITTNHIAVHTKYLVSPDQHDKFLTLAKAMLATTKRRETNSYTGYEFVFGYLMLFHGDKDGETTYKYWHILQFFKQIENTPAVEWVAEELSDTYDLFTVGRAVSTIPGEQWLKLSSSINQKTVSMRAGRPTDRLGLNIPGDTVRWFSCPHFPEPKVESLNLKQHFIETNPFDTFLRKKPIRPNYHVLQFPNNGTFNLFSNCRMQKLEIVSEEGDFALDDDDLSMHLEYQIPTDGFANFLAVVAKLAKIGFQMTELKYMIVLKATTLWNQQQFVHIYQTFQSRQTFATFMEGGTKPFKTSRALGFFFAERQNAKTWVKQDSYINGPSPKLKVTAVR